ncbi:hypothetical protein PV646_12790 [Streptomyces sp. ID05-26A]|nr:hypothetical protein [Streptomyces sp. ID05-26A]
MTTPTPPCPTCGHNPTPTGQRGFVGLRTMLIVIGGVLCAGAVGALTFLMNHNVPGAVLAGLCALGTVIVTLHMLLD